MAFCSQSYVIRWAHIIRDHCGQHLGIVDTVLPKSYDCDTLDLSDMNSVQDLEQMNLLSLNDDEEFDDVNLFIFFEDN